LWPCGGPVNRRRRYGRVAVGFQALATAVGLARVARLASVGVAMAARRARGAVAAEVLDAAPPRAKRARRTTSKTVVYTEPPDEVGAAAGGAGGGGIMKRAPRAVVLPTRAPPPTRGADGVFAFADHPTFRPNMSPEEVLRAGSFGGTYFRPIRSSVTGELIKDAVTATLPAAWHKGLTARELTTPMDAYDASVNAYGVKCGGSLEMWEGSGWISAVDPYGWFQWYCRFFQGRRSTDDERQIARWAGVASDKGRFRNQLIGRCARGGRAFDDATVSPVIRQTLQHWGYRLASKDADAYARRKGLPPLPRSSTPAAAASGPSAK